MALDLEVARSLFDTLQDDRGPNGRIGKVRRYLDGDHDLPYMPAGAKKEYRHLAERSITNWLPLIPDTYVKGLFVDGYRPANAAENARPWSYWQANGLDARQGIAHRGAIEHGVAYVLVAKGDPVPLIRPIPATRAIATYLDPEDEYPVAGLVLIGTDADGGTIADAYDATHRSRLVIGKDGGTTRVVDTAPHGMGTVPLVRFRDRLDGVARGVVAPLIALQDRANEIIFSTLIALQYASFRQRWATGLAIPTDDEGNPVEPFESAVDRVWVTDNSEARFGDFAQTEISGHLQAYESTIRTIAAIAQVSPNVLTGDLINLSADALAQMESSTQRKIGEFETIFGEAWEQVLRLAAWAAGDVDGATDFEAQVRWRDTEARSLASTVDALGKMAQMLMVPPEALWERVPGVTETDVARWRELADTSDSLGLLTGELQRQASPGAGASFPVEE